MIAYPAFERTLCLPAGVERRSPTLRNRVRRFFNDYWLVPLAVCYLQLFSQLLYSPGLFIRQDQASRTLLQEIPVLYKIATTGFPYTLLGHYSELANHFLYQLDLYQVTHEELKSAVNSSEMREKGYRLLMTSRTNYQSEIGGIITLSYEAAGPRIHLYAIPSSNETLSRRLHNASESIPQLTALLSEAESREILATIGMRRGGAERLISAMNDSLLSADARKALIENFVARYDGISESRYVLSPLKLKETIGKIPFGERFVGLYHFHNGFDQPPSSADIEQSLWKRQMVMTFSETGWRLYDVVKRDIRKLDIDVGMKHSAFPAGAENERRDSNPSHWKSSKESSGSRSHEAIAKSSSLS